MGAVEIYFIGGGGSWHTFWVDQMRYVLSEKSDFEVKQDFVKDT